MREGPLRCTLVSTLYKVSQALMCTMKNMLEPKIPGKSSSIIGNSSIAGMARMSIDSKHGVCLHLFQGLASDSHVLAAPVRCVYNHTPFTAVESLTLNNQFMPICPIDNVLVVLQCLQHNSCKHCFQTNLCVLSV